MSNQSIKYGILLTKEQLDLLKDDRQGFHRMTAFDTFVSMASIKPSVYQKTGFSASLSIGQFAISTVELSALWKCDRKTAAKVIIHKKLLTLLQITTTMEILIKYLI